MSSVGAGTAVRSMLKQSKLGSYALARAVAELQEADSEGFQELIHDGLMPRRRAYYLAKVGKALIAANVPDEILGRVGWTKLALIADRITSHTVAELVELARSSTVVELRQAIGLGGSRKVKHLTLRLDQDDYARVVSALVLHGATVQKSGVKNAGQALLTLIERASKG